MKIYKNFLFITIILSIFLINLFFYVNSRVFVNIYTIEPPVIDDSYSALISSKSKLYKNLTNSNYFEYQEFDLLNKNLYSNILRFFQNNKTYRFSFAKENNLSEKDKNLMNLVLKNISLEGAYFLNPQYLSTVQISFYNFNAKEKIIFEKYVDFIIEKEIEKSIINFEKKITSTSPETDKFLKKSFENEKLLEKLIFLSKNYILKKNRSYSIEEKNIEKHLSEIDIFLKEIELGFNHSQNKIDEFKINLVNLYDNLQKSYISSLNPVSFLDLQDFSLFELYTKGTEKNKKIFDKWVSDLVVYKKILAIKEEKPTIDKKILKKNLMNNIKFQEKKFNFKEFISLNLFGITFSFAFYFIFINFKKKN